MEIDPSIVKLLEEDEDETMHSGADLEAFQAALNRDIEGDTSTSQPSDSNAVLSQISNQTGIQDGKTINLHSQAPQHAQQPEQNLPGMEQESCGSIPESLQQQPKDVPKELNRLSIQQKQSQDAGKNAGHVSQTTGMPTSQRNAIPTPVSGSESQCLKLQMGNQQTTGAKQVPFSVLLPTLLPQLDKDRAMQLRTLYTKMQRTEISKEVFSRHMRGIVGNEKLRLAVNTSIPGQGLHKQQRRHLASYSTPDVNTSGSSLNSQPRGQLTHHQSMGPTPVGGSTQAINMMSGAKLERQNFINDPTRLQGSHISSNPVPCQVSASKELKSSPLSSVTYIKQKSIDHNGQLQHKSHLSTPQGPSIAEAVQGNAVPATSKDKPLEKELINFGFTTTNNMMPMNSVSPSLSSQLDRNVLLSSHNPSVTSPAGVNARIPQKKPSVGQKKPLEALGLSPPLPSKKQKVSGAFSDPSIEQLNDVTAVSGVNLQEETEQLFSGHNEDSRVSGASRRVVHEEEERGILLKIPLQKKLAEIMAKCGLKNISNDVERCLSLSVEERIRGLICNLIRLSKQRADVEKPMHPKLITSDVQQQIIKLNCKAKEEWEKKQVELKKLQKLDEPEGSGVDDNKEKDEGQVKSVKMNKEEDDKMRATAANVAARAAFGGDDMLSKWQLMAEQARQKRERGVDAASSSQAGKDLNHKSFSTSGISTKDNQEAETRGLLSPLASGAIRKFGRNQVVVPQTRVARTISMKDVIAVLEREPQMSRSRLIYLLYERIRSMAAV